METGKYAQQVIDFQKTAIVTMFDLTAKAQDWSEKVATKMVCHVLTDPDSMKTYTTLVDGAKKCRAGVRDLLDNNYSNFTEYIGSLSNKPA